MEIFQLLTKACSEECKFRANGFQWHKQFLERRESFKRDECPGGPSTAVSDDNTEKVTDVI
jgi:hypothetical protein